MEGYARLSVRDFYGNPRDFPVQFLCFFPAVGGKFCGAAGISGRFRRGEYRSGSVVHHWAKAGRRGRCGGDGDRPVPFRHRHCGLRPPALPSDALHPASSQSAVGAHFRNSLLLHPDLRSAVGDESGHSHGAGTGQQLRHGGHGRVCRRCEDRRLRLHAGAGLRQRLFHVHRPELRRKGNRSNPLRPEKRRVHLHGLLSGHIRPCLRFCPSAYDDFRGSRGDRDHSGGRTVSAH